MKLANLLTVRRSPPYLSSPLAIRLSKWSLPVILALYLALLAVWVVLASLMLSLLERASLPYTELLRRALWSAWAPDNLFAAQGESIGYYAVACANAVVSVLLPVFLLGAFVFKLFKHDPITWRKSLTIEAHPSGSFALTARFYNHFNGEVADINVRAWVRWNPPENRTVFRNRRLDLMVRGELDNAPFWPLALPAEPTTVRVLLCRTENGVDPLRKDAVLVQDEWIPRESAKLVIVVTGALTEVNEAFRSTKIYSLSAENHEIQEDIFQDISVGTDDEKLRQREWVNFDESQMMYIFMYGSLMRDEDLRAEKLDPEQALHVKLDGWRRAWNVASDPQAKKRVYRLKGDNSEYRGMVASLGVERHEGVSASGVMVKVDYMTLAKFDAREHDYDRTDVTHDVLFAYNVQPTAPFRIFTYVPKSAAVRLFTAQKAKHNLAIRKGYYDSIERAAERVGKDCLRDFNEASSRLDDDVKIIDMEFPGSIS